jgi:hypothetical protein
MWIRRIRIRIRTLTQTKGKQVGMFSLVPGICVEILLSGVVAARVLGTVGTLSARRGNNRCKKERI